MENENQLSNLKGKITGSISDAEPQQSDSMADLHGFQQFSLNKSKKKILTGIISGLAIILVGAVVVLAAGIWNPAWNPFQPSPDKILVEAFDNMSDIKAVHSKMIFDMDIEAKENLSVRMIIESDTDATDKNSPKSQALIDLNVFAQGMEMLFSGELRSLDDIAYFKLDTVPFLFSAQLMVFGINLDDWTGKWFRFDSKELGMSLWKTLSDEEKLEMEEKLEQLLLDYPIAKVIKKLAAEKIEGQNTYHYLLTLDQENLKQFFVGLTEISKEYYSLADLGAVTEEEEQKILDGIDEFFEKTGGIDFEIWIGRRDKLIYKVVGQKRFNLSLTEGAEEGTMDLDFDISFSKFNEPIEIIAPEDSQSILEMLMPLLQMFMSGGLVPEFELPGY